MAKKKKTPLLKIVDFFGICNTYTIIALKSELSAFPFANTLGKLLNTSFALLPDFEYASHQFSAHYTVFYAELTRPDSVHCLLVENKAVIDQQQQFLSKTEQKWNLQTGFLFEEYLYVFNKNGLRCFDVEFSDVDYLLFLYAKKNRGKDATYQFSNRLDIFQAKDVSFLLEQQQTSNQEKIVVFLRDFLCKYEVNANRFSIKRKLNLLAPIQQIPSSNLHFSFPVRLENEGVADNLQVAEDYLELLRTE